MLTAEGKRAKNDYIREYNKEHKRIFSARLCKDEYKEICDYLKQMKMNKAEFIRWAYEELKKQKNIDKISK